MRNALKHTLREYAVYFLAWTLIGLFLFSQALARRGFSQDPTPWWHYLVSWLTGSYICALLTPAVLWLGRRFSFERRNWPSRIALHLLFSVCFAAIDLGTESEALFHSGVFPSIMKTVGATFVFLLIIGFHQSVLTYWMLLGIQSALHYYRRYREREAKALRLELHASELNNQLARARLNTLKAQLQPHFLFNTLNAIILLVRQQNGAQAEEMLARLGDLLRCVLDDVETQEVPLHRELEYLKLYLSIEEVRFRDRLRVEICADVAILDAAIPHMGLQPIVENAIRHRIGKSSAAGKIRISAAHVDESLEIKVQDDGPGLPDDNSLPSRGIGLANTRARLHIGLAEHLLHVSMNTFERSLDPEVFVRIHRVNHCQCDANQRAAAGAAWRVHGHASGRRPVAIRADLHRKAESVGRESVLNSYTRRFVLWLLQLLKFSFRNSAWRLQTGRRQYSASGPDVRAMRYQRLLANTITIILALCSALAFAQNGAEIYKRSCAGCHDAPAARVPPFSALRAMDAGSIIRALESGPMKTQAAGLTSGELYALVAYLASPNPKPIAPPPNTAFCSLRLEPLEGPNSAHWSAWGVNSANTRFQGTAEAGITADDVPKLKLKWAFGLGDGTDVRSQPAVAGGRLFTADLSRSVYSLDASSGCIHWSFAADGLVRSGIVFGPTGSSEQKAAIYFGDLKGNTYAVNAMTGELLWKTHVENHFAALITGTPRLHEGVLYVPVASFEEALPASPNYECCTFRGSVVALEAATGKRIWQTYTIAETPAPTKKSASGVQMYGPSGAAVWSSPTFDGKTRALYIATGDNYSAPATDTSDAVLALDSRTGKILWSKQVTANDIFNNGCATPAKTNCPDATGHDSDFGQPPVLVSLSNGHRALVIGQKSGVVHALDPDRQGEVLWQTRVGPGGVLGGVLWGSAADRENVYVASSDLQLTIVADPSAPHGYSLGVDPTKGGGLFALRLETGEKVWSAQPVPCAERKHCSPAQPGAVTAIPGLVFSGSVDGHLRAYSASTGKVVWDADTEREYQTVNGQKAHGGSLDVAGPVIAGGMLYVNSGYGQWGGMPGNVLLAFSMDGR